LFEEVNKLQVLATCPELYPEFVKLQGVQKVTELMDHENVDVALSAVELIHELTGKTLLGCRMKEERGAAICVLAGRVMPR